MLVPCHDGNMTNPVLLETSASPNTRDSSTFQIPTVQYLQQSVVKTAQHSGAGRAVIPVILRGLGIHSNTLFSNIKIQQLSPGHSKISEITLKK